MDLASSGRGRRRGGGRVVGPAAGQVQVSPLRGYGRQNRRARVSAGPTWPTVLGMGQAVRTTTSRRPSGNLTSCVIAQ